MLKPKVLPQILSQACTNGVVSCILFNREGALLASSGIDSTVISAIFTNIWNCFQSRNEKLDYLLCECESGRLCITQVTKTLFLCLRGDNTAHLGMLKHKTHLLKDHLSEPLKQLGEC